LNVALSDKFLTSLCASAFLIFTLLFFGPSFIYYGNIQEFSFRYTDIVFFLFIFAFLLTIVLSLIISNLKDNIYQRIIPVVFALGLLFWIQGNLLVWNYGLWDGKQIEWANYWKFGIIDISIWIAIIILFVFKSEWFKPLLKGLSVFFIVVQLGALGFTVYSAPDANNWKRLQIDTSNLFCFSEKQNVILIVLDTFQSDIFNEIMLENASIKNGFDGFTYYPNATGSYPTTMGAIPCLLTGQIYDNSVPYQKYIESAYNKDSLPSILKSNGFISEVYPNVPKTVFPSKDIADNIQNRDHNVRSNTLAIMYKLSIFRHVPHFAKRYFYDTDYQKAEAINIIKDLEFYSGIPTMTADIKKPVFKFYHLRGIHPPFNLNENLEVDELPQDRNGAKIHARANIKLVESFLKQLKSTGIYDDCMIIIVADHGMPSGHCGLNNSFNEMADREVIPPMITSGIPLVLVKPFSAKGDLDLSLAPVSLEDVIPTIMTELGINKGHGKSVLTISEGEQRTRYFYYYNWTPEYFDWSKEYLPLIEEYKVNGFSWDMKSWNFSGKRYPPPGSREYEFKLDEKIVFITSSNNAEYVQGWGWSAAEENFTWTNGKMATLAFPVHDIKSDMIMRISFSPFLIPGKLDQQRINVSVEGEQLGEWVLTKPGAQDIEFIIQKNLLKDSMLDISLEFPDAASPNKFGLSDDDRMLGIAVSSITLSKIAAMEFNKPIRFSQGGNSNKFMTSGWSQAEKDFTWTNGKIASLVFPIKESEQNLILKVKLHPFIVPGKLDHQEVNVIINDKPTDQWVFSEGGQQEKTILIPKDLLSQGRLNIVFETPDAKSPKELGISEDTRELAIAIYSITMNVDR